MRDPQLTAAAELGRGDCLAFATEPDQRPGAPPLLAVAHGSRDPRAARTVETLLDRVRGHRPELSVDTAYLDHAQPTVTQALSSLACVGTDDVVVLPLLLTAAYHSKTDVPRALSEARRRRPRLRLHYGATLGPHPGLLAALERRLAEAGVRTGDPDTAVVLAAAGASDAGANATVSAVAREWEARGWWAVSPAYASAAAPTPAEAVTRLRAAGAPRIAVASYFLAPGYFADKVRVATLGVGVDCVAPVLGYAPELAGVVSDRYDEALRTSAQALVAV